MDSDSNGVCNVSDDDNDGVLDESDNCMLIQNGTQTDTDSDNSGDACDSDDDNHGVSDAADEASLNPDLCEDLDLDLCDDCSVGVDGLGILDDFDPSNDGLDTNGDGECNLGDTDDDGDGVLDQADNCPLISNMGQLDENGFKDGEGQGDACEVLFEELCIPVKTKTDTVVLVCL
ncbi:MAG: hypothetical protein ACI9FR_003233 [Cryomorphaceae bacterium]